jgi:hypothetical protein
MLGRMAYLSLAGVVLALWALMTQVVGPELAAAAGGQASFDARFGGYDLSAAQAYVDRLTSTGRDLYLEALHRLDGLFIPALAVFLIWSFAVLLPRWVALAMALVVMAGAAADLIENIRVATLLTAGDLTETMVTAASDATRIKAALDGFALLVFAGAVLLAGYRRFRQGKVRP